MPPRDIITPTPTPCCSVSMRYEPALTTTRWRMECPRFRRACLSRRFAVVIIYRAFSLASRSSSAERSRFRCGAGAARFTRGAASLSPRADGHMETAPPLISLPRREAPVSIADSREILGRFAMFPQFCATLDYFGDIFKKRKSEISSTLD